MKRFSWLISRYLVQTILPYFLFSWLLLTVILFVQQASRFSDIFFNSAIPSTLVWQLAAALIPNVIAFTCPMAVLVGCVIGLSKMQGDSELIAIRAAGVGNVELTIPIVLLGVILSFFAFSVNLFGVPFAASLVRKVALQTAIYKLESPIEPGVFNTDVAGYTIYVKDGNVVTGRWNNIFIYSENNAAGNLRLITSSRGRIDVSGDSSELVLENAVASTIPIVPGRGQYVSENIGDVRIAIKTRRGEMIEKLTGNEASPEELGISQLSDYASQHSGKERIEAQILWQRRIILSITPLIFCLLGTSMILRSYRGGRGRGLALALLGLIGYYLFAFLGEQLARTEKVGVYIGSILPLGISLVAILLITLTGRINLFGGRRLLPTDWFSKIKKESLRIQTRNFFVDLTTGLRDFDLIFLLIKNFLLALGFVSSIFVIFTAFDLWKFAGSIDGGIFLLGKYLFFLIPYMYLQVSPSAAMVSTLATYVVKSRQNEIIVWTSAGLSVYRLLVPCFLFMAVLGILNWQIQERILPRANQLQDSTRMLIRSRGIAETKTGKFWVSNENRIYSFEMADDKSLDGCSAGCVRNLAIYEFTEEHSRLTTIYRANAGYWKSGKIILVGNVEKDDLKGGAIDTNMINGTELADVNSPFSDTRRKTNHLDIGETRDQMERSESEYERRNYAIAIEKKYSTLVLPLIIGLFTAPFSLSLGRKGRVATIGYAVGLWLLFMGISGIFEQIGLNGFLSPRLAIWSPLTAFAALGVYLLSRIRT